MFPRMLLGFLWGVSALAAKNDSAQHSQPPLLLVSFDGFRADYLQRFPMPNLKLLYSQGVLVDQLTNVFITKTFPNHYSLVTGLYAESHGILASSMYDPISHKHFSIRNDSDPMWWSAAQPLWLTALDSGYKTAAVMWPGSDVTNRTPTHYFPYNSDMTFQQRLGNVTNWILGDEKEPGVMFAALYWEEPDRSGHLFGPENTTAMAKVLKEVDDNIGLLMNELKRTGLWGHINLIVTSDHGMVQCSADRLIRLDDCLHPDNYTLVDLTPVAALIPKEDTESVFSLLSKCHPHMTAYTKKSIPDRFHYRNHVRVQPIILIADEGWTIVKRGNMLPRCRENRFTRLVETASLLGTSLGQFASAALGEKQRDMEDMAWKRSDHWKGVLLCSQWHHGKSAASLLGCARMGDHGYDNSLPSMHPFLAATGPGFHQGFRMKSLQSVDVYPLMCRLLSVPGQPNNGSLTRARCLLAGETCWDVGLVIGLVVGVLLLLTTITVLFRCMGSRRTSGSRPFQRLDFLCDDDEPLIP